MEGKVEFSTFVDKARHGDRQAMNELVRAVKPRLQKHIERMTLDEHLAQDLVQESLMTMVREFKGLRDPERFWPWLSRIALNKVRLHYRRDWRKKEAALPEPLKSGPVSTVKDTLGEVIGREIKEIVLKAMHRLSPEHRAILSLRCYDQLSFPQIAEQLGCGEFRARTQFAKAKKTLGRNLARNGLSRGSLLGALTIFGKMTASSEAAVADISVTPTNLGAGLLPTTAATLVSQAAVVVLTTTLAVGTVPVLTHHLQAPPITQSSSAVPAPDHSVWYYYPPEFPDAVMIHTRHQQEAGFWAWERLQNEHANYHQLDNRITKVNARLYHEDLSVMRLPTDPPQFTTFLDAQEGKTSPLIYTRAREDGLLVMCNQDQPKIMSQYDIEDEESFSNPWPADTQISDQRSPIHQQGWADLEIRGHINNKPVYGHGQIPLVLSQVKAHAPRMQFSMGNKTYQDHKLFQGLLRPWQGLHCIDTIRRDAAQRRLPFKTEQTDQDVTVTITDENIDVTYTLSLEQDLIIKIDICQNGQPLGQLNLHYHTKHTPNTYMSPTQTLPTTGWWLTNLVRGD